MIFGNQPHKSRESALKTKLEAFKDYPRKPSEYQKSRGHGQKPYLCRTCQGTSLNPFKSTLNGVPLKCQFCSNGYIYKKR